MAKLDLAWCHYYFKYRIRENIYGGKFLQFFIQPQIMALLISSISLQKCYSKSFTANSYFPLKTQKFPPGCFPVYGSYIFSILLVIFEITSDFWIFVNKTIQKLAVLKYFTSDTHQFSITSQYNWLMQKRLDKKQKCMQVDYLYYNTMIPLTFSPGYLAGWYSWPL